MSNEIETLDVEARETWLETNTTLTARATDLRHALGMENPLRSPSKDFLARVVSELGDEEGTHGDYVVKTPEELRTLFKSKLLKDMCADILEKENIGTSAGPHVAKTCALLEEKYGKEIGCIAEEESLEDEYEARIPFSSESEESSDGERREDGTFAPKEESDEE